MLAEDTLLSSYLVEVSGWDEDESFFVEKSRLSGDDFAGKLITLHHNLSDGSLIFLRLLNSNIPLSAIPVAYEAHYIGSDIHGFHQSTPLPGHPRLPASRYSINWQSHFFHFDTMDQFGSCFPPDVSSFDLD